MKERPQGVPPEAVWVEEDSEWELGGRDDEGHKHGPHRYWRADGTLCNECSFRHGEPHGPFKRFHENGEVSQDGQFLEGRLHGTRRWFCSSEATSENTLAPGMSDKIVRSEMDYDRDRVLATRHYDAEGRRVLPFSGEPYPERPAGVPEAAELREKEERWVHGVLDDDNERTGTWRMWTLAGVLVEEGEWDEGERHGAWKEHHPSGALKREGRYDEGQEIGTWRYYGEDGALAQVITWESGERHGPYQDLTTGEQGRCEHDHAVGVWEHGGRSVDLGRVPDKLEESPSLGIGERSAEDWDRAAQAFVVEGRVREAILCLARGAARSGKVDGLKALLAERTLPRAETAGRELAAAIIANAGQYLGPLLDGIMRGGDPVMLLQKLAGNLDRDDSSGLAMDLIQAAMLLAPERKDLHFTRALVAVSLGRDDLARADIEAGAPHDERIDAFLRDYVKVIFPTFDFWPAKETPDTYYDNLPEAPAQSLRAIQLVVKKYATRLTQLREEMVTRVGEERPWMPPDVTALIPDGEVDLDVASFQVAAGDDDDEPPEEESYDDESPAPDAPGMRTVEIDELPAIGDRADLPGLLRQARGDWAALTWLLWSVGEIELRMPSAIRQPADYGKAAGMLSQRLWRCRDKVHMRGASAQQFEVPGFEFEGKDIDALHGFVAEIAENQYAEMQAMFKWLSNATHRSPWQDDLRGS